MCEFWEENRDCLGLVGDSMIGTKSFNISAVLASDMVYL